MGDRKGCRGATKMARVLKDAQRSIFLEGKNKNENLAPLVCLQYYSPRLELYHILQFSKIARHEKP